MAHSSTLPILMVISDNHYITRFFKDNFKEQYFVLDFSLLPQALETIKMLFISLIVLDQKLECPSIWEACQKINETKRDKQAPLFLVSNLLKKDFINQAHHAGVNDFLTIPLSLEEIHEKIALHAEQQVIKGKIKELKHKLPNLINQPPFKHSATYDAPKLTEGYLICIKYDVKKPPMKKFLESVLRPNDKIVFEENGFSAVFLGKTSNRAAYYIAETILSEAPYSTVIGIMPILDSKEDFEEGIKKAKLALPEHEKNKIFPI